MGGLRYVGTKAAIHGMAAFNITQKNENQTNNFSQKNHVYRDFGTARVCYLSTFYIVVKMPDRT